MTDKCDKCETALEDGFKFCPACGFPSAEDEAVDKKEIDNVCRDMVKVEATEEGADKAESGFWKKIRQVGRKVPFFKEALGLVYMLKDPALALSKKSAAIGAIIYFVTPMDIIPDFIPFAGLLDDAAVILWVRDYYRDTMGPYLEQAQEWIDKDPPLGEGA